MRDKMFQQAVERDASERPPAFVVESVGVVTEPARPARKEGLDHPQEMIVAALGTGAERLFAVLDPWARAIAGAS